MSTTELLAPEAISLRIATVHGQRVILDADLAALNEVPTKRLERSLGWPPCPDRSDDVRVTGVRR